MDAFVVISSQPLVTVVPEHQRRRHGTGNGRVSAAVRQRADYRSGYDTDDGRGQRRVRCGVLDVADEHDRTGRFDGQWDRVDHGMRAKCRALVAWHLVS